MKYLYACILACFLIAACDNKKNDKNEPEKNYVSILSLVRGQVAHIDTSLYSIVKVVTTDTLPPDTTFINRQDFSKEAKDFLDIPDLGDPKVAARFLKQPTVYDSSMDRVIISYLPVNDNTEEYKKQEIWVKPDLANGDNVQTIIINRIVSNRDGYLEKKLLWMMDRSFQIVTLSQEPGKPEKVTTTKVTWNDSEL